MSDKAIWPLVGLLALLMVCITVLLALDVDPINIAIAFTLVGSLGSALGTLFVYNKVTKVEANTNGKTESDQALLKELIAYAKSSTPMSVPEGTVTTTVTTARDD